MQLACPNLTQILNGSIQVSTHTLFIYHCSSYEARNFSQSEARFSRGLAKAGFHTHWQFLNFFVTKMQNHGTSFLQKWHGECGTLTFHRIRIKLPIVQMKKLKEKLQSKNFNLASDFMPIC